MDQSEGNLLGIFALPPRTETHAGLIALVRQTLASEGLLQETQTTFDLDC